MLLMHGPFQTQFEEGIRIIITFYFLQEEKQETEKK